MFRKVLGHEKDEVSGQHNNELHDLYRLQIGLLIQGDFLATMPLHGLSAMRGHCFVCRLSYSARCSDCEIAAMS